jgi:hypothetical protein
MFGMPCSVNKGGNVNLMCCIFTDILWGMSETKGFVLNNHSCILHIVKVLSRFS